MMPRPFIPGPRARGRTETRAAQVIDLLALGMRDAAEALWHRSFGTQRLLEGWDPWMDLRWAKVKLATGRLVDGSLNHRPLAMFAGLPFGDDDAWRALPRWLQVEEQGLGSIELGPYQQAWVTAGILAALKGVKWVVSEGHGSTRDRLLSIARRNVALMAACAVPWSRRDFGRTFRRPPALEVLMPYQRRGSGHRLMSYCLSAARNPERHADIPNGGRFAWWWWPVRIFRDLAPEAWRVELRKRPAGEQWRLPLVPEQLEGINKVHGRLNIRRYDDGAVQTWLERRTHSDRRQVAGFEYVPGSRPHTVTRFFKGGSGEVSETTSSEGPFLPRPEPQEWEVRL